MYWVGIEQKLILPSNRMRVYHNTSTTDDRIIYECIIVWAVIPYKVEVDGMHHLFHTKLAVPTANLDNKRLDCKTTTTTTTSYSLHS